MRGFVDHRASRDGIDPAEGRSGANTLPVPWNEGQEGYAAIAGWSRLDWLPAVLAAFVHEAPCNQTLEPPGDVVTLRKLVSDVFGSLPNVFLYLAHSAASLTPISMSFSETLPLVLLMIFSFQDAGISQRSSHLRMAQSPAPQALAASEISFHFGGAFLMLMICYRTICPTSQGPKSPDFDFLSNAMFFG